MSLNNPITVIAGNLTDAPELTFLSSGTPVANFTIAHNTRSYDRSVGGWVDGETVFLRAKAWRRLAEHATESLSRGDRVVAVGTLASRTYSTREGERRTITELTIDELGASLHTATVRVAKAARNNTSDGATESEPTAPENPDAAESERTG